MAEFTSWQQTPEEMRTHLTELARSGQMIKAIQEYMRHHQIPLSEAIELVGQLHPKVAGSGAFCPACGEKLRTALAKQCFKCGKDWH
jgi:hypothetical protein